MNLQPVGNRIIMEPMEASEGITKHGILISAGSSNEAKKATIVAVGEVKSVKVDDVVLYSWGDPIEWEGNKYLLATEDNINAIIKEKK